MGRSEKPITTSNVALAELARWLRRQRAARGLTYAQLAARTGRHATTLQRAASAASVPTAEIVEAYARGCDASVEVALQLRLHARQEHLRTAEEERDQDHAGDGAEIGAAAAEDRGAAEHDGGDRRAADRRRPSPGGLAGIAGEQHAAEGREAAREREGDQHDALRVDAATDRRRARGCRWRRRRGRRSCGSSRKTVAAPTTAQTITAFGMPSIDAAGREIAHRRRGGILRREAAGVDDHQALRDRVDGQRDDHRGDAQIGDADAVDEAERDAAEDAERNGERPRRPGRRRPRRRPSCRRPPPPRAPTGRSGRAG